MFERFDPAARALVPEAQARRRELGDRRVRTGHLLLALLADPGPGGGVLRDRGLDAASVAADLARERGGRPDGVTPEGDDELLRELGVDVDAIRRSLDEVFGPGALDGARRHRSGPDGAGRSGRHGRFDAHARRVLQLSLREALRLGSGHIGPEHIGLALLVEDRCRAHEVLIDAGMDLDGLRRSWEAVAAERGVTLRRRLARRLRR